MNLQPQVAVVQGEESQGLENNSRIIKTHKLVQYFLITTRKNRRVFPEVLKLRLNSNLHFHRPSMSSLGKRREFLKNYQRKLKKDRRRGWKCKMTRLQRYLQSRIQHQKHKISSSCLPPKMWGKLVLQRSELHHRAPQLLHKTRRTFHLLSKTMRKIFLSFPLMVRP